MNNRQYTTVISSPVFWEQPPTLDRETAEQVTAFLCALTSAFSDMNLRPRFHGKGIPARNVFLLNMAYATHHANARGFNDDP